MGGAKKKKPGTEKVLVGTRLIRYALYPVSYRGGAQKISSFNGGRFPLLGCKHTMACYLSSGLDKSRVRVMERRTEEDDGSPWVLSGAFLHQPHLTSSEWVLVEL